MLFPRDTSILERSAQSRQEAMCLCLRGRALGDAPRVKDGGLLEWLYLNSFHPVSRLFESTLFIHILIINYLCKHRLFHDVRSETTWKIKSLPNFCGAQLHQFKQYSDPLSVLEFSAKKHSKKERNSNIFVLTSLSLQSEVFALTFYPHLL